MHAAEGPQRVDRAVSSPLSIISLGDVGGGGAWRCDRSSYKRSLFSRIQDSLTHCTASLGLRSSRRLPSPSRICVESNHSGMGKPIVLRIGTSQKRAPVAHSCAEYREATRLIRDQNAAASPRSTFPVLKWALPIFTILNGIDA